MFEGFELVTRGRNRRAGLKELQRYADAVMPAELMVSWAHRVWSGQRTQGRGLGPCQLTDAQLRKALAALDAARERWAAVAEGETLTWSW